MQSHTGRRITVENLGELFKTAYLKSATLKNAINNFKCTGIHPYNVQILPSSDFVDDPRCEDDTPSQQLLSETATSANLSTAKEEPTCSSWQLSISVNFTVTALKLIIMQRGARASAWGVVVDVGFLIFILFGYVAAASGKVLNCSSSWLLLCGFITKSLASYKVIIVIYVLIQVKLHFFGF